MPTQAEKFDAAPWFDALADYAKAHRHDSPLPEMLRLAETFPNKAHLTKMRLLVVQLRRVPKVGLRNMLVASIDAIMTASTPIRDTYKYRYHTYPKFAGQCSATGELFSLIRQAITYHD